MEIPIPQLPPGDPRLVDAIVSQLKSKGIFDKFRKECLADVDTKPAFLNLRQRVDGQVKKFLDTKTWKNDLNKNQLRDGVRKNIQESGILDTGIDAIINQVVNPKIKPLILPLVEDTVYNFLQIEKPKRDLQEYDHHAQPLQLLHRPPPYHPQASLPQNFPPYPMYQEIPPPFNKNVMNKEPVKILPENENNSTTFDNSSVSSESEVSMDEKMEEEPKVLPITPAPPVLPALPPDILPMETDVISSGDDEILARDSSGSNISMNQNKNVEKEIKVDEDNAVDSFDSARGEVEANMATAVEKMSIKDEHHKEGSETHDSEKEITAACLPLFDNRSLDSISSNTSGLSLSPNSQNKSLKDSQTEVKQSENSTKSADDLRSTQSTPLVDEKSPIQDVHSSESSKSWTPYTLPKLQSSERVTIASFASFGASDSARVVEGASPVSAEDSQGSIGSSAITENKESISKEMKAPRSDKSEGEITSSSTSSSPEQAKVSSGTKISFEQDIKQSKSDSTSKSSHRSDRREREKSKERQHKDKRHSRDREWRKSKSKHDDHSSHHEKDKYHRKDKDDDKDRDRHGKGHHSSSGNSSRTTSGDGSSKDKRDKGHERSSDHKSHSKSHSNSYSKSSSGSHSRSHHSSSSSYKSSSKSSHSYSDSRHHNKDENKSSRKSETKDDKSSKQVKDSDSNEVKIQKVPLVEHKNNGQLSSETSKSPSKLSLDLGSKLKNDQTKAKSIKIVKSTTLKEDDTFALHLTNEKKNAILPKPTTSLKTPVNKTLLANIPKPFVDENKNKVIQNKTTKENNEYDDENTNESKLLEESIIDDKTNKFEKTSAKVFNNKTSDKENKSDNETILDIEAKKIYKTKKLIDNNKNTKILEDKDFISKARNKEGPKAMDTVRNTLEPCAKESKANSEDRPPIKIKIDVKRLKGNKSKFNSEDSENSSDSSDNTLENSESESSDNSEMKRRISLRKRNLKISEVKPFSKVTSCNGFLKKEGKKLMKTSIIFNGCSKSNIGTEIVVENPSPPPKLRPRTNLKRKLRHSSSDSSVSEQLCEYKDESIPKLKKVTIPLFNISNNSLQSINYEIMNLDSGSTCKEESPSSEEEDKEVNHALVKEKRQSPIKRKGLSLRARDIKTKRGKLILPSNKGVDSDTLFVRKNFLNENLINKSDSWDDEENVNSLDCDDKSNPNSLLYNLFCSSGSDSDFEGFDRRLRPRVKAKIMYNNKRLIKPKEMKSQELVVLCDSDSSDMEMSVVKFCRNSSSGNSSAKDNLKSNDFEGFSDEGFEDSSGADQKLKDYLAKFSFGSMVQLNDFILADSDEDKLGEGSTVFFNKKNTTKSVIEEIASMKSLKSLRPEESSSPKHGLQSEQVFEFSKDSVYKSKEESDSILKNDINSDTPVGISEMESNKPFKKRKLSGVSNENFSTPKKFKKENHSVIEKSSVEELVPKDILNTYSLLTPEEDRTSSKEYEVDLTQGASSYSPLSPASDSSSEGIKAKLKLSSNTDGSDTVTLNTKSS